TRRTWSTRSARGRKTGPTTSRSSCAAGGRRDEHGPARRRDRRSNFRARLIDAVVVSGAGGGVVVDVAPVRRRMAHRAGDGGVVLVGVSPRGTAGARRSSPRGRGERRGSAHLDRVRLACGD